MGWRASSWILLVFLFCKSFCEFQDGDLKIDLVGQISDYGDFYGNNEINIFTFLYYKTDDLYTNVIFVYSLDRNESKYKVTYVFEFQHKGWCEGMIVTDWTMDSRLDALLFLRDDDGIYIVGLTQSDQADEVKFSLAWSSRELTDLVPVGGNAPVHIAPDDPKLNSNIHPLLCDINGDGLVDMVTQSHNGTRVVWINNGKGFIPYEWDNVPGVKFIRYKPEDGSKNSKDDDKDGELFNITVPHSNAFVDINGDCRPDLLFTVAKEGENMVEIWLSDVEVGENSVVTNYTQIKNISLPNHIGQLVFADFNGDGSIDIGIPSCTPDEENPKICKQSGFSLMTNHQQPLCNNMWNNYDVTCRNPTALCEKTPFNISGYETTKFDNSKVSGAKRFEEMNNSNFGDILRFAHGDFDFDGFPDLAFIASNVTSPEPSIVVYKNMLFDKDPRFSLVKSIPIKNVDNDYILSFFDVFEDGDLNVLLFALPNEDQINKNVFLKAGEKGNEDEKDEEKGEKEEGREESDGDQKDENDVQNDQEEEREENGNHDLNGELDERNERDENDEHDEREESQEKWERDELNEAWEEWQRGENEENERGKDDSDVEEKEGADDADGADGDAQNGPQDAQNNVVDKDYDLTKYDIDYLPFASYKWKSTGFGLFLKASSIGPLSHIHFQDDIKVETNIHGPVFMITVSDIYGEKTPKQAIQRPLSGYTPLQLPYVIFGLGNTNNYVEEFYLGMSCASKEYKYMWISIIPNCFVIAVTFPLDIPSKWNLKLSINPSKKFLPILYTNLACLAVIGLFIILFHAKEKREDSENEKGFKQKFIAH